MGASHDGSVYANLTPTLEGGESVSDRKYQEWRKQNKILHKAWQSILNKEQELQQNNMINELQGKIYSNRNQRNKNLQE